MTIYAVIAYRTVMYAEILDAVFSTREAAEKHAQMVQFHLNKTGVDYTVKVEALPLDQTDSFPSKEEEQIDEE